MARLSSDGIFFVAGSSRICGTDSRVSHCAARRHDSGSSQSTSSRNWDASFIHAARLYSRRTDSDQNGSGLAHFCSGIFARCGECLRYPCKTVLSRRHGWKRRPDERHRIEFFHVQRRSHSGSSYCRRAGGGHWRGLVFFRECCQLYRRDHWLALDASGNASEIRGGRFAVATHARGFSIR